MKNKIVFIPSIKEPIQPSPGFLKKQLAHFKLDILGLCGFGCSYCSSNTGNSLRIHRASFALMSQQQLGEALTPFDDPGLTYVWPDVIEKLERQLAGKPRSWGQGETLVYSMLTDAFSPWPLTQGITRRALELVLERTSFRIRVLTKNSIVGTRPWIEFFLAHPGRFVVGLSIGTLDHDLAGELEKGTSTPKARIRALRKLQDAGVPTFGMLCPVFPSTLEGGGLESLLDAIRPELCEKVWSEVFNDRANRQHVRDSLSEGRLEREWLQQAFGTGDDSEWSRVATELYLRLKAHASQHEWSPKLRYLLYEDRVVEADVARMGALEGILLQSKHGEDGLSQNPAIAALQRRLAGEQRLGGDAA